MRQILLIADPGDAPSELRAVLHASGAEVLRPRTPEGALRAAQRTPPALVVIAVRGDTAWELTRALKEDPRTAEVPVMAFRREPGPADKQAARRAGADSYDGLPLNRERLLSKIEKLFSDMPSAPLSLVPNLEESVAPPDPQLKGRVLLVQSDQALAGELEQRLRAEHYEVRRATSSREATAQLDRDDLDVMLLDLALPGGSGLELLWNVRERLSYAQLPIIVITQRNSTHDLVGALELGANDYILRPVDVPIVLARLRIHVTLQRASKDLAKSEARYRLLAEHSSDIVTRADVAGTWSYVSPASKRLLGYAPAELVGRSAYDLIHPDDFNALAASYDDIVGHSDMYSLRFRMQRKDGAWAWFEATLNALRGEDGEVAEIQAAYRDVTSQVERNNAVIEEMMVRFGRIAEFRSGETYGHIQRMSHACGILARRAGCDSLEADQIRVAATLHDFGNILIPMGILHKEGPLDEAEWEVVRRGPELGWELLKDSGIDTLERAATISWYHHEHWDGSGYPRGRRSKGIPLEGRVALICDCFDMMTSDNPGRPAMSVEAAIGEMVRGRGTRFDPELLDLFLADLSEIVALRKRFPDPS
ncbi:MAG: PAS domain S-box protein [Alphaproteobacteria bacterium]|nr:PAS domain S-box protein [Alphaproteobacteria bacterium]MCB9794714.1 PAS domain S-box protein [Alphaproteobacteria bacterium]